MLQHVNFSSLNCVVLGTFTWRESARCNLLSTLNCAIFTLDLYNL